MAFVVDVEAVVGGVIFQVGDESRDVDNRQRVPFNAPVTAIAAFTRR